MAWIYLVESVGSASHLSLGSGQSHTASENPMHKESCSHEWNAESLSKLPSGTMLSHYGVRCSENYPPLISSQPDFRAKTSVLQDLQRVWTESEAVYSSRSQDSQMSFDLPSSSLRMSLPSEPVAERQWSKHWPRSGMTVDGQLLRPPVLEPSIEEKGGFSWPTPSARDHKGGYQYGRIRNGKVSVDTLDAAVQAYRPGGLLNPDSTVTKTFGQLNPQWVEWLMGYPVGWSALSPLATVWFRSKSKKRSKN